MKALINTNIKKCKRKNYLEQSFLLINQQYLLKYLWDEFWAGDHLRQKNK